MAASAGDPYAPYVEAWRRRAEAGERERERLAVEARGVARRAARRLRELGAERVYLYGSLLRAGEFDERSDIDVATAGIAPGRLWDVEFREVEAKARPFRLDIRALEALPALLREGVLAEGEVLE